MRLAGGSSVIDIWTEGGCGAIENAIIKDGCPGRCRARQEQIINRNWLGKGTGIMSTYSISIVLSAASISAEKGKQHRKIKSQSVA